ncbi:cysteine proteinase [Xylariaceae sp. FL0255]|nr:cysteine proteinase [Xylariaceae sp. FL0255]
MNGSHLPAGQPMPGGVVGGAASINGNRRRPLHQSYHQPYHHHQQQPQHAGAMYSGSYMNPYATSYYPPQMTHPYQNSHIPPTPSYSVPYNAYPQRSPPTNYQPYPAIVSSSMQPHPHPQPYPRPPPQQPSPALSTPPPFTAAAAPAPPPPAPRTPISPHTSHIASAPPSPSIPQLQTQPEPESQPQAPTSYTRKQRAHPVSGLKTPNSRSNSSNTFSLQLPWLSVPDQPFPPRAAKGKRRRRGVAGAQETPKPQVEKAKTEASQEVKSTQDEAAASEERIQTVTPSTPASAKPTSPTASVTSSNTNKPSTRGAIPAVPVVPAMPKASPKDTKSLAGTDEKPSAQAPAAQSPESSASASNQEQSSATTAEPGSKPPAPAGPKLWSGLFQRSVPAVTPSPTANSNETTVLSNGVSGAGHFAKSNASSLAEALHAFSITSGHKIAFLEPRGLINTGNMCYMNSVLQVLIFCLPFYDFLDQVSKKAAHSFKSETPLIDAMVMFMREYKVIDSAVSVDQLKRRLKSEELEQYGEPFTPEFVYNAMGKLPRFASMQRGHQQDAEEFLGFLLESLHDECAHVMQYMTDSATATAATSSAATPNGASSPASTVDTSDWLEVGRKQRAAVTRSSGHPITSSPLTKIFGGQLRSELRVQGLKDSVTLEPFQPLQLDIGSPQIRNIVDALRNLTRPETIRGDFGSPRGLDAVATKQVFIESIPPVLILHLKRFHFDAAGTGTVKIWKKVGYPLELELPKEIFSRQKRNALQAEGAGFPRYKLIAAVYHHGKNASGGHYTVDLRRQDGREWIRLDDTVIRRIRSDDVAEGGVEEELNKPTSWVDKKDGAAAPASGNRFEGIGDDDAGDDDGWNKVSSPANGTKKWSSIVNDSGSSNSTPAKAKAVKDNSKENKVAYLLFYQKI